MIRLDFLVKSEDIPSVEEMQRVSENGNLTINYERVIDFAPEGYDLLVLRLIQCQRIGLKVREINISKDLRKRIKQLEFRDRGDFDE